MRMEIYSFFEKTFQNLQFSLIEVAFKVILYSNNLNRIKDQVLGIL